MHNAYLHKALRSFEAICDQRAPAMFVFGHSLAANDDHILRKIERGRIQELCVSLHGKSNSEHNTEIIARALTIRERRLRGGGRNELKVKFFDAESAAVWG